MDDGGSSLVSRVRTMSLTPSVWPGRRVFLTGHTGFKGAWLSYWLTRWGADVTGYALAVPSQPALFDGMALDRDMRSVHGDVRDLPALERALVAAAPEVVFHMAAQSLVRPSYADPVGTYATNVMGTVHLLQATRAVPSVRAVVIVTSDKCYENSEWPWGYREIDPMGGHDPYSNSKGCAELVTASFRRSFFGNGREMHHAAVASARAGNVIGGGDWAVDRLLPDLVRGHLAESPVVIRHPNATRPWQHVLEPLHGYMTLAEHLLSDGDRFAGAWNFGPRLEDAKPVHWIADQFTSRLGPRSSWMTDPAGTPLHEAHSLRLDWSKAHAQLHWTPTWTVEEAVARAADWYREFHSGGTDMASVRAACDRDLDAFTAGLGAR